jgi:Na+-driven multidrug efflux pump
MLFSGKDLRKLIVPLMFEQLLAVLVGLVDTLMVSQSGEAAVAGVALVDNINRLIIQVMAALATGGAVVCSQYIGKGRDDESRKSGAQLETVLLIFSVIMTAFSVSFTRPLLKVIFGTVEDSVMDCAVLYFVITALSYPFLWQFLLKYATQVPLVMASCPFLYHHMQDNRCQALLSPYHSAQAF